MLMCAPIRRLMDKAALSHEIKEIIVRELKLEGKTPADIDERAPLFGEGLGLDSVDALELVVLIEEKFNIQIPDEDVGKRAFASIAALADYVSSQLEGSA